ncbi:Polypeptide-transport-associated domain protein FtsQ-type [Kribbella flavida DSM 17836]|uniref:Polypeptide-transport-associated domain protein FtsQ-type n=1 Tax=Kribbella flavida (strain DSM 17836 / JCM 10339 / NBRC 14399) TaxID=479435 RepID=D2Q0G1_KRIFD|nr:FtsQ-type POTRA domain-containing protein [Kribbella flavida]ADB31953.1 Polypeptide-transport-associated domain protein FtsQ-type [Kribbella flavida DSM 17836]
MSPNADLARAQQRFARRQRLVRWKGWLPWAAGGVLVLLGAITVWLFYSSSALAVEGVRVTGIETVPEATVTQVAAAPLGTPLAKVDLPAIAERVRTIQAVADAQVTRAWPNHLEIVVTERVPVVVVTDGSRFELVDATGVSFKTVPTRPDNLPEALVVGSRRDVTIRSVVTVSAALPVALRSEVRSISAGSPDSITLNLGDGVKVVWGGSDDSARKAEVLSVLMRRQAKVYDVSAPDLPVTKGEKR